MGRMKLALEQMFETSYSSLNSIARHQKNFKKKIKSLVPIIRNVLVIPTPLKLLKKKKETTHSS